MPLYVDRQRISCKAGNKEKVFRPFHGRRRKYKEIAVCWRRKEAEETILTTSTVLEKRLPSAQLGGRFVNEAVYLQGYIYVFFRNYRYTVG